jgi:hypothetical protein
MLKIHLSITFVTKLAESKFQRTLHTQKETIDKNKDQKRLMQYMRMS